MPGVGENGDRYVSTVLEKTNKKYKGKDKDRGHYRSSMKENMISPALVT